MASSEERLHIMTKKGGKPMEVLILVGIVVAWFILQMWVLPRLGVKT